MKNVDYEMIIRYFNGKCEDDERRMIVRWANESDEHARQLFEWEEMYFLGKRADGLERERIERAEKRRHKSQGGDKHIAECILSGGDERVRIDFLSLFRIEYAEENLCRDGCRYYHIACS